jgi:hypothetical protein
MRLASLLVAGLLASWFVLELVIQFPFARCKRLRFLDPTAHLLAAWNFFAPKPIMGDVELFFRYEDGRYAEGRAVGGRNAEAGSGASTSGSRLASAPWILVQPNGDRRLYHLLINPQKRARKAVFRCCNYVITNRKRSNLPLTVPYLLLLDRVTMLCPAEGIVQFQIDVIRKDGSRITAFRSVPHRVDGTVEDAPSGVETGHDCVQPQCV